VKAVARTHIPTNKSHNMRQKKDQYDRIFVKFYLAESAGCVTQIAITKNTIYKFIFKEFIHFLKIWA
jgi:hypothetical protein